MAEALAALSLFCNVLAVAEFAYKILKTGYEVHKKGSEAIPEHEALEKCSEELFAKNQALQQSLADRQVQEQDPDDIAIQALAIECNQEARNLINELRRVASKHSTSRFEGIRSALRVSWHQSDIDAIARRMRSYQEQMNSRLISSINLRQKFSIAQQTEGFEQLFARNDDMSAVLKQIQQGQQSIADHQGNQYQVLINVMITHHQELLRAVSNQPSRNLDDSDRPPAYERPVQEGPQEHEPSKDSLLQLMEQGQTDQVKQLLFSKPALAVQTLDHSETTALHIAAASGNFELVRALIRRGANINAQNEDNLTPLHAAVKESQAVCTRYLLQKGANIRAKDEFNKLPVHYTDPSSEIFWILEHGPDIDSTDADGNTALMHFIRRNDVRVVESLLRQGVNPSQHTTDTKADTPLIAAVDQGSAEIVALLISAKAEIDGLSARGDSPLFIAVMLGHYQIVKLLIDHNAALNTQNKLRFTPLLEACWHHNDAIGTLLIEAGADVELAKEGGHCAIHLAAAKGCLATLRAILTKNPLYVDAMTSSSWTPLCEACHNGQDAVVDILLECNADVRWRPQGGLEPVAVLAAKKGHTGVIQTLVEKCNIDLELYDASGKTALFQAIDNDRNYTVHRLLQLGALADTRELTKGRWSPLAAAINKGNREVVRMLLEQGNANPNLRNGNTGATPLSEAVRRGHRGIIEDLLDHGADPNLVDVDSHLDGGRHYPPICIAAMNARRDGLSILTLLVERGKADLSLSNARHRWTALHEVSCHGPLAAVKYLLDKGADVDAVGIEDRTGTDRPVTPLDLALRERDRRGQIVPLLREHKAKKALREDVQASRENRDEWDLLEEENGGKVAHS